MKALIVDDDFTSRVILQEILKYYASAHVAVNGAEAIEAVRVSLQDGEPYNLICLDIMMPEINGQEVLIRIRQMENEFKLLPERRARIIITSALGDKENVMTAIQQQCDHFLVKPIKKAAFLETLTKLGLIM